MRIGLLGLFGGGNSGNDGSLEAMIDLLRRIRPDAEIVCICPGTEVVERAYGARTINSSVDGPESAVFAAVNRSTFNVPRRLGNIKWAIKQAHRLDAIIVPGTGFFDDFNDTPFGWPYLILRWFVAARINRVPIYLVSIGAGPIHHPLSRAFMKASARMAAFRSYRDHGSRNYMKGMGVDTSGDAVTADLAFRLPAPVISARTRWGKPIIGVGLMSYSGWNRTDGATTPVYAAYLEKISEFVNWLLARGMTVRLLTGDLGDKRIMDDLRPRLREYPSTGGAVIAERIQTLHDLMRQIAQTDVVVATRYHNVVCALKLGRPTISLSYASKNDELLRRTGLAEFCQHVETFDLDKLKTQFEMLVQNRFELERGVRRGVDAFCTLLDEQDERLREALASLAGGVGAASRQTQPDFREARRDPRARQFTGRL